ncbi:MAG: hypothetical protein JNK52_11780 [Zoogloeaceae bacterium]|nr:hypothetical protein [Zoogloeaceae bacterium]
MLRLEGTRSNRTASAAAFVAALLLGGCAGMQGNDHGRHEQLTAPELAKRFVEPGQAVGAIVVNRDGELVFVDEDGKVVEPCRLCDEGDEACMSDKANERIPMCKSTTGTTITGVTPLSVVSHTGSRCILVTKQGLSGYYTYQICW